MRIIMMTAMIGILAGIIDVLPMVKMKLDKYSITSAFVFYFCMPFIILNTNVYGIVWWLKGSVITLALAIPMILIVAKEDKKSVLPMAVMAVILGFFISTAGHFFI